MLQENDRNYKNPIVQDFLINIFVLSYEMEYDACCVTPYKMLLYIYGINNDLHKLQCCVGLQSLVLNTY
jgi:hypothetical protein